MLNAREIIENGKAEYKKLGVRGAIDELVDYHTTHDDKDDQLTYSRLSVLSLMRCIVEIIERVHSDEGLDDEEFWSDYSALK